MANPTDPFPHTYLNSGKYVPCTGPTIGEIISYLQQFPPEWPVMIGDSFGSEPVLINAHIVTVLDSIGPDLSF